MRGLVGRATTRRIDVLAAAGTSQAKRDQLAIDYGRDGYALLEAVYDRPGAGAGCASCRRCEVLRVVLLQNYVRVTTEGRAGGDQAAGEGA